jgi:hypothetical protein
MRNEPEKADKSPAALNQTVRMWKLSQTKGDAVNPRALKSRTRRNQRRPRHDNQGGQNQPFRNGLHVPEKNRR